MKSLGHHYDVAFVLAVLDAPDGGVVTVVLLEDFDVVLGDLPYLLDIGD
jgi:hypothetical protein